MARDKASAHLANSRMLMKLTRLSGQRVEAFARVNVVGVSAFVGLSMFITGISLVWGILASRTSIILVGVAFSFVMEYVPWALLRRRGGPLRFGSKGAAIGLSSTTLFLFQNGFWGNRPAKLLGSWPRDEVSVTVTRIQSRTKSLQRFDLRLHPDGPPSHLEIVRKKGDQDFLMLLPKGTQSSRPIG